METRDFYRMEAACELRFHELGTCYHLCTGENSPILFHNESEFETAMNIIALASSLFPDIRVLTFEVMSNHLHFALCGNENRIHDWFEKLVALLKQHPDLKDSKEAIASLRLKLRANRHLVG